MEYSQVIQALQAGGNAALLVCVWFIIRASERLARIEKALQNHFDETDKE